MPHCLVDKKVTLRGIGSFSQRWDTRACIGGWETNRFVRSSSTNVFKSGEAPTNGHTDGLQRVASAQRYCVALGAVFTRAHLARI